MKPNKKRTVIGFTGGVGSGKSTVLSEIEKKYDVFVIRADEVGRTLMAKDRTLYRTLVSEYGPEIVGADGEIDRARLSAIAFSSEEAQARINQIEHPVIKTSILRRISHTKKQFIFLEAALLKEGALLPLCDETVLIVCNKKVREMRLKEFRGYSEEKTASVMRCQMDEREYRRIATKIFDNSGTLDKTVKEISGWLDSLSAPKRGDAC